MPIQKNIRQWGVVLSSSNPPPSLGHLLVQLWRCLSQRRQRQSYMLMGLMLVSAFAEVLTLGATLPFLSVLITPGRVFNHPSAAIFMRFFGIDSADQLVLPITIMFVTVALAAGAVRTFLAWGTNRTASDIATDLSIEVYRRTLYQPYHVHLARNSSEVISGYSKVTNVTFGILMPMLTLASSTTMIIFISLTLIFIDPFVALVTTLFFGITYFFTTKVCRRKLTKNSERIGHEYTQVVKSMQEGLGAIRDVLLDGTQAMYCENFVKADRPLRRAQGENVFISTSPRYAMESFGLVLIATLAFVLTRSGGIEAAIPVLGALAVGAQRLLPALQQSYATWASITGSHLILVDVIELLYQPISADVGKPAPIPMSFKQEICFKGVRFQYVSDGPWVIDGLDLTITKGARVGFVGSTGSGKSTTLDLFMGLLVPTEGELLLDGQAIDVSNARAWQRAIAHVPQNIFLADATLAENIAFGIPRDAIDMERVKEAARHAQIADFIEGGTAGYNALVGERGIRLSGGQRQRIGIARALFKQASVLVFDEATSALDNTTEHSVMEAIAGLDRDLTILIIAHRLTTVRHCDKIVELSNGRVLAQGNYDYLLENSPSFRHLSHVMGQ